MTNILQEYKDYLKLKDYSCIYVNPIKLYLKFCERNGISFLTMSYQEFTSFFVNLKDGKYSNGYINNFIKALKSFYLFLFNNEKCTEKVFDDINKLTLLKTEQKIKDFLTVKELEDMIRMAITFHDYMNEVKIRAIIYFLFYTGVRKGEFLNLKRKDIDLKERSAIIRVPTKNKNERIVFFPKKVEDVLKKYFGFETETENSFCLNTAQLVTFNNFITNFGPKDKKVSLHTFRHSFANMLAEKSIDIRVAQKLLGHKSINSTMIYYNPDNNIIKKLYKDKIR